MHSHNRKSSRKPKSLQESYSERERFAEHREDRIFLNYEQIKHVKQNKQPYPNSLKRNIIRDLLHEEERNEYKVQIWPDVSLTDRFILIARNSTRRIRCMSIPGESKSCSMQSWRIKKELSKKLVFELSKQWKN